MRGAIEQLLGNARRAQRQIAGYSQRQLRALTQAVAWAVLQPERNRALSEQAVADTGFGNVADKITKNHRKTLGLLRDLQHAKTTGVIAEIPSKGLTEIARPIGVVGALTPSTNPVATPTNKIINALACGNAIIVSPSPKGAAVFDKLLGFIHTELKKTDAPPQLVQAMPQPPSKENNRRMMESVDLVVVTGSQRNVRAAYASGTPAIGVGVGNVTTIIDESAPLEQTALKIQQSKTFDHATSCSSENNAIVVAAIYADCLAALQKQGGQLLDRHMRARLQNALWPDGKLNPQLIGKGCATLCDAAGIESRPDTRFLLVESDDTGADNPLARERMAPVLTLYKADDFAHAVQLAEVLLRNQGAGHSVGLHSLHDARALTLARQLPACRVIVNQAHCFATGGAFNNGLPFSLSMGCGSWGKNSISDNLNYRHYMNITRVVREIPTQEPSVEALLGDHPRRDS